MAVQLGPDTSRMAQIAVQIGNSYQNLAIQTQQIKTAEQRAITGAIQSVMQYKLAKDAQALERERIGIAQRRIGLREKEFAELQPLRAVQLEAAETQEERDRIKRFMEEKETFFRGTERELEVRAKAAGAELREVQTIAKQTDIALAIEKGQRQEEAHNAALLEAGIEFKNGQPVFNEALTKGVSLLPSKRMKKLQDYGELQFWYRYLASTDGTELDVPRHLQNRVGQGGKVSVASQDFRHALERVDALGGDHQMLTMIDEAKQANIGKAALPILNPSGDKALNKYIQKNVGATTWVQTLENEMERASDGARSAGIFGWMGQKPKATELRRVLADAKKKLPALRREHEGLRAQILGLPRAGQEVPLFGAKAREERRTMFANAEKYAAKVESTTDEIRDSYVAAMKEADPAFVFSGYWPAESLAGELEISKQTTDARAKEVPPARGVEAAVEGLSPQENRQWTNKLLADYGPVAAASKALDQARASGNEEGLASALRAFHEARLVYVGTFRQFQAATQPKPEF